MLRTLAVLSALAVSPASVFDDPAATHVALAGPEVLVLRDRDEGAELLAVPRTGGPARTLLSVGSTGPMWASENALAASDQRVAVFVEITDRRDRTVEYQTWSGPPSGPLEIVRRTPETWEPVLVDVDAERVLLVEAHELDSRVRALRFDPAFGFVRIAWAKPSFVPVAIAGDYAAVVATRPRRVAVVDLATGAERTAIRLPRFPTAVDVAADGRVVVAGRDGLVTDRSLPDTKGLKSPRFAGDTIVAVDRTGRPVVLLPDGSRQSLEPPTRIFTSLAADASGFAWLANGCVRYAPFAGASAQADDPCPSTEIGLYAIADAWLRGRRIRVPVICVTAPSGICRGTVLGRFDGQVVARGRFAVRAGRQRWVRMRVSRAAVNRFRRAGSGFLIIRARVPDGRVGAGADGSELSVKVRRAG